LDTRFAYDQSAELLERSHKTRMLQMTCEMRLLALQKKDAWMLFFFLTIRHFCYGWIIMDTLILGNGCNHVYDPTLCLAFFFQKVHRPSKNCMIEWPEL